MILNINNTIFEVLVNTDEGLISSTDVGQAHFTSISAEDFKDSDEGQDFLNRMENKSYHILIIHID